MTRWIPLSAAGAALVLSACTGVSPGPYDAVSSENPYDAPIYDEGGLYQPGLDEGGVEDLDTLMGPEGPAEPEL